MIVTEKLTREEFKAKLESLKWGSIAEIATTLQYGYLMGYIYREDAIGVLKTFFPEAS